ncbi:MAG: hypothetical protein ACYDDF_11545 [Thermoplasmatota archaeon]
MTPEAVQGYLAMEEKTLTSRGLPLGESQAGLATEILGAVTTLDSTPDFVSLLQQKGPNNFTMGFTADAKGLETAEFQIAWTTPQAGNIEYWVLDLHSHALTGPVTASLPAMHFNSFTSYNWAGMSFCWSNGVNNNALGEYYAELDNIPTISAPPVSQQQSTDNSAASDWIGVSPNSDGSGGLLQSGVFEQTTSSEGTEQYGGSYGNIPSYAAWYECYKSGGGYGPYPFSSGSHGAAGDHVDLTIEWWTSNTWYIDWDDTTSSTDYNVFTNLNNCVASYTPYWAHSIMEAPTDGNGVLQISDFTNTNIYGGEIWNSAQSSSTWQASSVSAGTYNTWNIQQTSSGTNTGNSFSGSGSSGNEQITWSTSAYSCSYVGSACT